MEYADFVEKCIKEYKETENEFTYQLIAPFSETIVEKTLSKEELKKILLKGMQKSIPLDKVKQAREEIENKYDDSINAWCEREEGRNEAILEVLDILDKLIESET